ncbi:MAG TPA: ribosome assembly factor SBDS [Candidatus Nanoarchaeia archaeon]|nr:ribosome assembly factor SBDS [Candidatus Nanoarchaeia archaeon]
MTTTLARIKKTGKNFEIIVDLDNALKFKRGQSSFIEAEGDKVFSDSKKGNIAPTADLQSAFGTSDVNEIAAKIVKEGEVLVTQEFRDEEREKKIRQVVDFLANNAIDPKTGNPHTPQRIQSALEQAHVNIKNTPIDQQMKDILEEISKVIPIKVATKKVKIHVPSMHTGKVYGVIAHYKEEESWKDNGDLEVIVKVPAGMIIDFYEKLNGVTHGSALTEEMKE